jgi:hypothetical protein
MTNAPSHDAYPRPLTNREAEILDFQPEWKMTGWRRCASKPGD